MYNTYSIEGINNQFDAEMEKAENCQNEIDRWKAFFSIEKNRAKDLGDLAEDYYIKIDELNKKIDAICEENELLGEKVFRLKRVVKMLLSMLATFPVKDEFDLQDIFDCRLMDGFRQKG